MDCNKCSEILSLYVFNELTQTEADEVAKHLSECDSCSKQAKELSALLSKMSSFEAVEPPGNFLEKVTKKAEKELWNDKVRVFKYTTYLKIASIAAIFVVSFMAFRQLDDFRAKSTSMSMNSSEATAAYGKANESADNGAKNNSSASKSDTTTKALQDSKLEQAPQSSTGAGPKAEYDIEQGAGKSYDASINNFTAKDIVPSTTPAPEKNNMVTLPETENKTTFASTDTPVTEPKTTESLTKAEDAKNPDEHKVAKTLAGDNTVSIASILSDDLTETQVQIKAKDKAAASKWVRDQAQKVNGTEVTNISITASSLTTQESAYASPKAITSESAVTDGDKIIIDVSKENADKFKNSIVEYFGKDNVLIEENTISSDTVRFVIVINE